MDTDEQTLRILLVDDDEMLREALGAILHDFFGHGVTHAGSASEALDILEHSPAGFDVLLTDYCMPELTGLDLVREVQSRSLAVSGIVVLSAEMNSELAGRCERFGITHVMRKPPNLEELNRMLHEAAKAQSRSATAD